MMQIRFALAWHKAGKPLRAAFKQAPAHALFDEYRERISKFTPCEASGIDRVAPGDRVWVLDRGPKGKTLSSEDVARELGRCLDGGVKKLWVMIGPPDGWTPEQLKELAPALHWSFGPLTLPHELAAVVASEQVYRAWSILKRLPYHSGH